jgi:hypothetical protein
LKQAPKVSRFPANYIEAKGTLATPAIGPARYWKKVAFDPVPGLQKQNISSLVEGYDKNRRSWDTLFIFSEFESPLSFINVNQYNFIRTSVTISDSSANSTSKIGVRSLHLDFEPLPELTLIKNSFAINPDTVIQGASPTLQITVKNESTVDADSMTLKSFINNTEERSVTRDIKKDSSFIWSYPMNTINLPAGTASTVKVSIEPKIADLFDFNNVLTQTVFVRRDTTNPQLAVTVDGVELESGDILPPQVTINFKLKDNTALPFDTNAITIRYNNRRLSYKFDSLSVVYMPFPNSEMNVAWKATLKKGRDTIDIRAKDPSGNYYSGDSTYLRYFVNVYTEDQLLDVYNYPNPFSDGTNFTFQIRGKEYPQSVGVKIYTVAGRLIKEIETDVSKIHFGMNYFYWDGKDQDGSEIANGTYLYKLICRYSDKSLTQTQKLVKMR